METYDIPNYQARKAALIEKIIAAFDGVSREGGVSMSEANVIDDYGSEAERAAARASDIDTRWQDVTEEQLAENWPISFLDAIGFRYYLPAYLIYYLHWVDDYIAMEDDAPLKFNGNNEHNLACHLSAGYWKGEIKEYFLAEFEMFSPVQGQAIAHFLQLEAEREDAWKTEDLAQLEAGRGVDEKFEEWKAKSAREEAEKLVRLSPEELEELEARYRENELFSAQFDSPDNDSRYALEKYWGRFL